MRLSSSLGLLLLSMACQPPIMARPDCTEWNSRSFFEEASSNDVGRCLSEDADPQARTKDRLTPLHLAASLSNIPALVQVLLDAGADLNARDKDGWTPLHYAAGNSKTPEVVKALLDAGADLNAQAEHGVTPLHGAAARSETPEVVQVLLDAGADPKARTKDGQTVFDLIGKNPHLRGTNVYWQLNNARFD